MKTNHRTRLLIGSLSLLSITWCATSTFAANSLKAIPPLGVDTSNEARAITPDGSYVVGLSGTSAGFLYNVTNDFLTQPYEIYLGTMPSITTGVAYRTDTNQVPAVPQLIVSGLDSSISTRYFTEWMSADGGTNWDYPTQVITGAKPAVPVANGLAGTTWDYMFSAWSDQGPSSGDNWSVHVCLTYGYWPGVTIADPKGVPRPNSFAQVNGVSSNGRGVGWRENSGVYNNYIADMPNYVSVATPAVWYSQGLDGTTVGQVHSIDADGTIIFGTSPKGAATGDTNYPYKVTFNSTFPGTATQLSNDPLPVFSDVIGCPTNITGTINVAIPYGCSADGKYAVGMAYRGSEKAVLWDTSAANSASWTVTDLTDLASTGGILGDFTTLNRAYSIGIDGQGQKVIAGVGTDTNGFTRGFVMTVNVLPPVLTPAQITSIVPGSGTYTINYTGGGGTQFVLLNSSLVTTPMSSWSRVATNFTGSGSFVAGAAGSQQFWRIKSE